MIKKPSIPIKEIINDKVVYEDISVIFKLFSLNFNIKKIKNNKLRILINTKKLFLLEINTLEFILKVIKKKICIIVKYFKSVSVNKDKLNLSFFVNEKKRAVLCI